VKKTISRKKKIIITSIIVVLLIPVVLFGFVMINHQVRLSSEHTALKPMGKMVSVNEHDMHVFTEGTGDATLVFLSGYGTGIPSDDFAPICNELSNEYRVAVIERAGYGYSDETGISRDIDTVVEENREALRLAGVDGPVVIVPHSMSGLEALYWAQKYPEEVKAIIGIDAAFPDWYLQETSVEEEQALKDYEQFSKFMRLGFIRFNSNVTELVNAELAELSDEKADEMKALIYKNLFNLTLINEQNAVYDNACTILETALPTELPVLCFISDGTQISPDWQQKSIDFWSQFENANYQIIDCGHYIHNEKPEIILPIISNFLENLQTLS